MSNERSNHLGMEQLADYASGRLVPAEASRVDEHLAGCPQCQEALRWLLATTAALAPDTWEAPPLAARAAARRAFRQVDRPAAVPAKAGPPSPQLAAPLRRLQQGLGALLGTDPWRAFRPALGVALTMLVLFISLYAYWQWQGAGTAEAAVPSLVRGNVQVKLAEAKPWQAVSAREEATPKPFYLHAGAEVQTGDDSSLLLTFFENSSTQLGEETDVVLQELARDAQDYTVALLQRQGRVEASVEPEPGQEVDFQIETPSALVQVTGTRFVVVVGEDGSTEVSVQEGTVAVTGAAMVTWVAAGEAVVVLPGAPPAPPVRAVPPAQPTQAVVGTPQPPEPESEPEPGKATKPAPAATPGPAGQPDEPPGQEIRPTRRPLPEQVPTRKTPPGQAPDDTQELPPGQQVRPTRKPLPTQAARPNERTLPPQVPTRRP